MKENFQMGDNRANSKISVEVEDGVLSVSDNRLEFVSLEGKQVGFGMSFCSEQISRFLQECFKDPPNSDIYTV